MLSGNLNSLPSARVIESLVLLMLLIVPVSWLANAPVADVMSRVVAAAMTNPFMETPPVLRRRKVSASYGERVVPAPSANTAREIQIGMLQVLFGFNKCSQGHKEVPIRTSSARW